MSDEVKKSVYDGIYFIVRINHHSSLITHHSNKDDFAKIIASRTRTPTIACHINFLKRKR
jgi:hypothetical protein